MSQLQEDRLITLRQAATTLPCRRVGRPTHASTLWRWATQGLRGVKLEIVQVGGTKCTSREALDRFFEQLAVASRPRHSEVKLRG
jgi:hypothetical protein